MRRMLWTGSVEILKFHSKEDYLSWVALNKIISTSCENRNKENISNDVDIKSKIVKVAKNFPSALWVVNK